MWNFYHRKNWLGDDTTFKLFWEKIWNRGGAIFLESYATLVWWFGITYTLEVFRLCGTTIIWEAVISNSTGLKQIFEKQQLCVYLHLKISFCYSSTVICSQTDGRELTHSTGWTWAWAEREQSREMSILRPNSYTNFSKYISGFQRPVGQEFPQLFVPSYSQ